MSELAADLDVSEVDRLLQAEGLVRTYCGWHIAPERDETLVLDGSGACVQTLPSLKVADVTAVTSDGVALDIATLDWSEAGLLRRCQHAAACTCRWSGRPRGVTVTLRHGHNRVPAEVSGVVRDIAQRAFDGRAIQVGLVRYSDPGGDLLATEKAVLDRYKLPKRP